MPGEELAKGCLVVLLAGFLQLFLPERTVNRLLTTNYWQRQQLDAEEALERALRREKRRAYRQRRKNRRR